MVLFGGLMYRVGWGWDGGCRGVVILENRDMLRRGSKEQKRIFGVDVAERSDSERQIMLASFDYILDARYKYSSHCILKRGR